MKKVVRWILISGVICCLAGTALMTAGAVMGGVQALRFLPDGRMTGWTVAHSERHAARTEPAAPAENSGGGISDGGAAAAEMDTSVLPGTGRELFGSPEYPAGETVLYQGIRGLELEALSGIVEVAELETLSPGEILICSYGEPDAYHVYQDEEELVVSHREKMAWLRSLDGKKYGIAIGVAPGFRFHEVSAEIMAGSFTADRIFAEELSLELKAGEVKVLGGAVGKLDAECMAGALSCMAEAEHEASAECAAGSVAIVLSGSQRDYDYEIECLGGEILLNGEQEQLSYSGLRDKDYLNNQSGRQVELSCRTGEITVEYGGNHHDA
ncbi:MAG: DUF4097 family beta strand repeat-containing protein [Eubacteriales bacterium]|nr:DUF4097 family beta strand repeat-containing protein [Eubacteriales bacterium]